MSKLWIVTIVELACLAALFMAWRLDAISARGGVISAIVLFVLFAVPSLLLISQERKLKDE